MNIEINAYDKNNAEAIYIWNEVVQERRSFMQTVTTLRHAWSNTVSMQFQIIDDRIEEYSEIIK